jgi:four helix bundle protein
MERDIQERTFRLALAIATLGRDADYRLTVRRNIIRQLVRAATSVGANVEEASGAQTKPDFVAKMAVARKEAREVNYWLRVADIDWAPLRREAMSVSQVVSAITRNAQRSDNRRPRQT